MAGLILVRTPEEVTESLRSEKPAESVKAPDLPAIVSYLRKQWAVALRRKDTVEREMIAAQKARAGQYSATEVEQIKRIGGTDAYRNLCDVKCRTAAAWIRDIILQPGDDPFSVEPTNIPELPEPVVQEIKTRMQEQVIAQAVEQEMQTGQPQDINQMRQQIQQLTDQALEHVGGELFEEAKSRSAKMQTLIVDQLNEAKWTDPFSRFIDDLTTYHAGILKGPTIQMRKELEWTEAASGEYIPQRAESPAPCVERVHPLDFYPVNPYDLEYAGIYERHQWHPGKLQKFIGVPGWKEEEIRRVLADHSSGSLGSWLWTDTERNSANKLDENPEHIDCLECWESVPGSMLADFGLPVTDMDKHYQVHAFLVGTRLIRLMLNPHPLGKRPYHTASYVTGDTVWGRSIHSLIKDSVKAACSIYRSAINNCAMAWGPMAEVNKDRLAPGDDGGIYPLKRFVTTDDQAVGGKAVYLTDIPYKGDAMLRALVEVEKRADDESGVPAYAHGSQDISGAGKTSSGLSMLLGMATKTIKDVVRSIDGALEGLVEGFYIHNMEFHPDPSVKGDAKVSAKGSSALIIKEQMAVRLREFLAQTANQIDMQITGVEGRAYALKEAAKGLNLEADKLVPTMPVQNTFPDGFTQGQLPEQSTAVDAAGQPIGQEALNAS